MQTHGKVIRKRQKEKITKISLVLTRLGSVNGCWHGEEQPVITICSNLWGCYSEIESPENQSFQLFNWFTKCQKVAWVLKGKSHKSQEEQPVITICTDLRLSAASEAVKVRLKVKKSKSFQDKILSRKWGPAWHLLRVKSTEEIWETFWWKRWTQENKSCNPVVWKNEQYSLFYLKHTFWWKQR